MGTRRRRRESARRCVEWLVALSGKHWPVEVHFTSAILGHLKPHLMPARAAARRARGGVSADVAEEVISSPVTSPNIESLMSVAIYQQLLV